MRTFAERPKESQGGTGSNVPRVRAGHPHETPAAAHLPPTPGEEELPGIRRDSPGRPLDGATRTFMEPRFGYDFSNVRVHTHQEAQRAAADLNARAFTVGNHIVFGTGAYTPGSEPGRSLIAHELAHTIQQQNARPSVQARLNVSTPADRDERAADAAAQAVMSARDPSGSSALRIRDQLRRTSLFRPTLQRAVATWGGEYDTDKYELTSDAGMDGVDMVLRFKPGKNADAELIGMTQTARSMAKGAPIPSKMFGPTAEKTFESWRIPSGETDAGTMIDRISTHGNPLYATDKPGAKDKLADTPTVPFWGRHGWRYTDKAGKLKTRDALLKDRPQMPASLKESSQTFEATALAVKGAQTGTFYGSVRWGWEKDAAGKVKKLPLSLVSKGVPSATFGRASELWNVGKTSEGKATIDLPVVDVKVIIGAGVEMYATAAEVGAAMVPGTPLPVGTRFRNLGIIFVLDPPIHHIEIVDGPLTGQKGYISADAGFRDER